jgi:hypothetical protein
MSTLNLLLRIYWLPLWRKGKPCLLFGPTGCDGVIHIALGRRYYFWIRFHFEIKRRPFALDRLLCPTIYVPPPPVGTLLKEECPSILTRRLVGNRLTGRKSKRTSPPPKIDSTEMKWTEREGSNLMWIIVFHFKIARLFWIYNVGLLIHRDWRQ